MRIAGASAIALLLAFAAPNAPAQGINTNVALPIAEGEAIWRSQLRYLRASDDPSALDRDLRALAAPQTLAYGITPQLTAFATLATLPRRKLRAGGETLRRDEALGDLTLLGRYMLHVDDYAPLSTRRAALLGGVKFPTGADRFGTPSFDPIVGGVATWAANRHEWDVDVLVQLSTERHDIEAGDRLRYDLAYRYRLWPERFGRRAVQLNGILELNGLWTGRTRIEGRTLRDTGGHLLFVSPGLQLAARRFVVEASAQLPIVQDLRGPQLETDFVGVVSVRIPFALY